MPGPSIAKPETLTQQGWDTDAVNQASDFIVGTTGGVRNQKVARAIIVTVAGNLKVDTLGNGGPGTGQTGVTIAVPVGVLYLLITKLYSTANGTTATVGGVLY